MSSATSRCPRAARSPSSCATGARSPGPRTAPHRRRQAARGHLGGARGGAAQPAHRGVPRRSIPAASCAAPGSSDGGSGTPRSASARSAPRCSRPSSWDLPRAHQSPPSPTPPGTSSPSCSAAHSSRPGPRRRCSPIGPPSTAPAPFPDTAWLPGRGHGVARRAPQQERHGKPRRGRGRRAAWRRRNGAGTVLGGPIGEHGLRGPGSEECAAEHEGDEVPGRVGEGGDRCADDGESQELGREQRGADLALAERGVPEPPSDQGAAQDAAGIDRRGHSPMSRLRSSASCSAEVTASSLSPAMRRVSGRVKIARPSRTRTAIVLPSGSVRSRSS